MIKTIPIKLLFAKDICTNLVKDQYFMEIKYVESRAVDGKRFLESNASWIPGTYFRLGYVKLRLLESRKHSIRGTFYRQLPLI